MTSLLLLHLLTALILSRISRKGISTHSLGTEVFLIWLFSNGVFRLPEKLQFIKRNENCGRTSLRALEISFLSFPRLLSSFDR